MLLFDIESFFSQAHFVCFDELQAFWVLFPFHYYAFVSQLLGIRAAAADWLSSLDAYLRLGLFLNGDATP